MYFRKSNNSDATQFALLFTRVPAHGKSPAIHYQPPAQSEQADVRRSFPYAAWAALWIAFELGVLVGFMLLGIVAFKRTDAEMYQEAGELAFFYGCGRSSLGNVLTWGCVSSGVPPNVKYCLFDRPRLPSHQGL